jgi:flagellar hook protein FlgE
VNGVINAQGTVGAINIPLGSTTPASATANVQFGVNLDATTAAGTTFNAQTPIYDSLGNTHILTVTFTKSATANTWGYSVAIPAADVTAPAPSVLATGTLSFTASGQLAATTTNVSAIPITGLADGAANMTFNWTGLAAPNQTITQFASAAGQGNATQDGFKSGTLTDFTVDQNGVVQGSFSNGQSRALAQVALATFGNEQGLNRAGSNSFEATIGSGAANVGVANTGGKGSIIGGSLELSNVDIATEFARLIVAQRGYQANAKSVTTFDQVTQDTINLKQ